MGLAEMLQFLDDWPANTDPAVRCSFARFAAANGYPIENLCWTCSGSCSCTASETAKSCSNPSSDESRSGRA